MRLHPCFSVLSLRINQLDFLAWEKWMKMAPKYSMPWIHYCHIQEMMSPSSVTYFFKLWQHVCKSEGTRAMSPRDQWSSQPWKPNLLQHLGRLLAWETGVKAQGHIHFNREKNREAFGVFPRESIIRISLHRTENWKPSRFRVQIKHRALQMFVAASGFEVEESERIWHLTIKATFFCSRLPN